MHGTLQYRKSEGEGGRDNAHYSLMCLSVSYKGCLIKICVESVLPTASILYWCTVALVSVTTLPVM